MRTDTALEYWVSLLRNGRSLAIVELVLSEPASITGGNVDLRCTTRVGGTPYGVLVFTSAPSAAIAPLKHEDPVTVLFRVATAVAFLHSMDAGRALVHGNLNIDSISMLGGIIVLSGFEHCGINPVLPDRGGSNWTSRPLGHRPSLAPELVESEARTTQTDVYAFGVLMFRMYAGKDPFDEIYSRYGVACTVQMAAGRRPLREEIRHPCFSNGLWELMTECWAQEPSARPTMESVRARLAQML